MYKPFTMIKSWFSIFKNKNTAQLYYVLQFIFVNRCVTLFIWFPLQTIYFFFVGRSGVLFTAIVVMGVVISYAFGPFKQYDHQRPFDVSFNVYCYLIVMLHAIGLCFIPKSPHSSSNNFIEQYHDKASSVVNLLGESQWTKMLFPVVYIYVL